MRSIACTSSAATRDAEQIAEGVVRCHPLTTSDLLAVLALGVAVLSFAVTVYEQYLKRPKLGVALGDNVFLAYGEGHSTLARHYQCH